MGSWWKWLLTYSQRWQWCSVRTAGISQIVHSESRQRISSNETQIGLTRTDTTAPNCRTRDRSDVVCIIDAPLTREILPGKLTLPIWFRASTKKLYDELALRTFAVAYRSGKLNSLSAKKNPRPAVFA